MVFRPFCIFRVVKYAPLFSEISEIPSNPFKNFKRKKIIRSSETRIGEYFSGSLAAADLDGDGLDELLVGSPLASVKQVQHNFIRKNLDLSDRSLPSKFANQ